MINRMLTTDNMLSLALYAFSMLLTCLFSALYEQKNSGIAQNKIKAVIHKLIIATPTSLLFGLRDISVGYDTYNNYLSYVNLSNFSYIEAATTRGGLFSIILKIIGSLSNLNFTVALLLISYITTYLIIDGILKFRGEVSLSIGLFVYLALFGFNSMDQMRQMLAMAIWFNGLYCIQTKQFLKYALFTALSSMIHISMLLGFVIYFCAFDVSKQNEVLSLFIAIVAVVLSAGSQILFSLLGKLLGSIDYYSNYFSSASIDATVEGTGSGLGIILVVTPLLLPLVFSKSVPDRMYWLYSISAWMTLPLRALGYTSFFLSRLYLIPGLISVLSYGYVYASLSKTETKMQSLLLLLAIPLLMFSFSYFTLTSHGIVPYVFAVS